MIDVFTAIWVSLLIGSISRQKQKYVCTHTHTHTHTHTPTSMYKTWVQTNYTNSDGLFPFYKCNSFH